MNSVRMYRASELGYVRRAELEDECNGQNGVNYQIWEQPNGLIHVHDPRNGEFFITVGEFGLTRPLH